MENSENRPNAALINREWFDAARTIMSIQDLGIVLVRACEYVFGTETFDIGGDVQKAVFAMIKPALDSDIAKYRERCARNAANAKSQWQRVAASGTQSQRVAANTTTTTTTTTTSTSSLSESADREKEIERDKWLVIGYFWSIGSKAVTEEYKTFWSYYESLGWKNNKGAAIVSRLACARMWRRQFETGEPKAGADAWFRALQSCPIHDPNIWHAYRGAERTESGAVVRLACTAQFLGQLKEISPQLEKTLQNAWKVPSVSFETAG